MIIIYQFCLDLQYFFNTNDADEDANDANDVNEKGVKMV